MTNPAPAAPNLLGVWRSTRDTFRCVYVTRVDSRYVYGFACDSRGRRLVNGRTTRIQLNARGDAPKGYRRLHEGIL